MIICQRLVVMMNSPSRLSAGQRYVIQPQTPAKGAVDGKLGSWRVMLDSPVEWATANVKVAWALFEERLMMVQARPLRVSSIAISLMLFVPLLACGVIGPGSIRVDRLNYNEVIQQTYKQQTFANIIRVRHYEPTTFVDVTQISASVLGQATLGGAVAGIGRLASGSSAVALEYQESPTIQYQPLLGAALVTQLATPITADSLGNLFNSGWPLGSLLMMAVDRITPGFIDYASAVDALIALDDLGAINITPSVILDGEVIAGPETARAQSQKSPRKSSSTGAGQKKTDPVKQQSFRVLMISLEPTHPRGLNAGSETSRKIQALWCRFTTALNTEGPLDCLQNQSLTFRTPDEAIPENALVARDTHLLRTWSAYGILKAATEPPAPFIEFVDEQQYRVIRSHPWNSDRAHQLCLGAAYYTLLPEEVPYKEDDADARDDKRTNEALENIISNSGPAVSTNDRICLYTISNLLKMTNNEEILDERRLFSLRRLLLVIRSSQERPNSYVSYFDGKSWYSIDGEDEISQKNFVLIAQFLTMQATATPPPPLTPTIAVGSR